MMQVLANQTPAQAWRNGGGQTRELLAWPSAADWQLRISRADIESDGPFSAFVGVQRWFVVLSGNGVLLSMPTADGHTLDYQLLPGHAPLHFDGSLAPCCKLLDGPTQDLNMMVRSGKACVLPVDADQPWTASFVMCGLYTAGGGVWNCGTETLKLAPHTLLWLEPAAPASMRFSPDHDALPQAWWMGYTPKPTA